MMKKILSEILTGVLISIVFVVSMVSCVNQHNDWLLEQDRIELEQRYKDGLITLDEYLSVQRQWEKNQ